MTTLRFVILLLILATNGFFAAAEVSLISVRQSRLRELARRGQAGAQSALNLLANPGRLLSVTQVGITLASLGLGWAGEDTLYKLLRGALDSVHLYASPVLLHGVAFAVAFLIISYAHVILGEVVPKNLALDKADRVAVLAAPVLLVFYRLSQPFVIIIERTSTLLLRVLGLRAGQTHGGHTPEELKYIVQSSRHEGHLHQFEQDAIQRLIELSGYSAREIMTPRHNIISLSVDASPEEVLGVMAEHKYTRVPVYEDRPEQIIGIVHYKDLMRLWDERRFAHDRGRATRPFRLRRFLRKPLVVPETKPLNQLIDEFRASHNHMALVVDEFGTVTGLVTLEDVLEQIFGEIGDEHDVVRPAPSAQDTSLELEGSITIRDLETRHGLVLPGEAGFETLAGFLLFQFGHIPNVNDSVEYGGRRFTITRMDRNRIATVLMEKLEPKEQPSSAEYQPSMKCLRYIAAWILVSVVACPAALAQFESGEVRVFVSDATGLPLPSSVTLTSESSQTRREFNTNDAGQFTFQNLPFGVYHLTVEHSGFTPYATILEIHSALPREIHVQLNIKTASTEVVVSDTATLLDPHRTGVTLRDRSAADTGRGIADSRTRCARSHRYAAWLVI